MDFDGQLEFTNRENRFMLHCGIRITELCRERCCAELDVGEYCRNTGGTVHGGLLYTMADCAVSAYARATGGAPVTLGADFHYIANVADGRIAAEAEPVQLGGRIELFRVRVFCGEETLAEGSFTCYRR